MGRAPAIRPQWADATVTPPVVKASVVPESGFGVAAYPNPFNPATMIRFTLPAAGQVDLNVYDVSGRFVANLVHGQRDAGANSVEWRATTSSGEALASGAYIARIQSGSYAATVKLLLVR